MADVGLCARLRDKQSRHAPCAATHDNVTQAGNDRTMLNFHIAPTPSDSPVFPLEGGSPRRMSIVKRYLVAVVIVGVGVCFE